MNVALFLSVIAASIGFAAWLKRREITAYFDDVDAHINREREIDV